MTAGHNLKNQERIFGLDLLRALAILFVVFFHSTPLLQPLTSVKVIGKGVALLIKALIWLGPIAVDLFFVLSGFLIGKILIKTFANSRDFKLQIVFEFWIKRWFRTLPNYILLVGAGFLLYKFLYNYPFDWRYYFFIQNFAHPMPLFFGETWSLSIEEWTYLLLPVALLIMSKLFAGLDRKKVLRYTLIIYIIAGIGLRFWKVYQQNYQDMDEGIRKITLYRLDSIIYGVIVAYFVFYREALISKFKRGLLYIGVIGVAATLLLTIACLHRPWIYHFHSPLKILVDTLFFTFIPAFFSLTLPASYFYRTVRTSLVTRAITHISLISYSLYLIHNTLIFIPFFQPLANSQSKGRLSSSITYCIC